MKAFKYLFTFLVLTFSVFAGDVVGDRLKVGNTINLTGTWASIGGGDWITNQSYFSVIGGGWANEILSPNSTDVDSSKCVIGGGGWNLIEADAGASTIGGGAFNRIEEDSYLSVIAGGDENVIAHESPYATIGGGGGNVIGSAAGYASLLGGLLNTNAAIYATLGGGYNNDILSTGEYGFLGGGYGNTVSNGDASVLGGSFNVASGPLSTVAGGDHNVASGRLSFAAGYHANPNDEGAFVWADASSTTDVSSPGVNTFSVRASGGIWLGTSSAPSITAGHFIDTSTGAFLTSAGVWSSVSDRNAKENFLPVDNREVLNKLKKLSVQTWNYKAEEDSIRHIGVMAQDFS